MRPRPRSGGVDIGAVSRGHAIGRDMLLGTKVPVLSLIGGKWTTFRAFAEQTSDTVLGLLGKSREVSTEDLPIGGGRGFAQVDKAVPQKLVKRYGSTVREVTVHATRMDDRPLMFLPGYSTGEIAYNCGNENVRRMADLLLRRTAISMEGLLTPNVIAAGILSRDKTRTASEIDHAQAELARRRAQSAQYTLLQDRMNSESLVLAERLYASGLRPSAKQIFLTFSAS